MLRHERTLVWDFAVMGFFIVLASFAWKDQDNVILTVLWLSLAAIRLILMIYHQIKWRRMYKLEVAKAKEIEREREGNWEEQ